jgi:uncharacterized protein involved in cysteine biosynthesis
MEFGRAFTYFLDDREWTPKLLISAGVAFFSVFTSILLIGLLGWALLLGYLVELIHNLNSGLPTPLPRWANYTELLRRGGNVLAALIVYSLPLLIPICCYVTTSSFWGDNFIGSAIGFGVWCCIVPLVLIYNLVTWPMFALAVVRYAEEDNIGVFFQFGDLLSTVYRHTSDTLQWIFFSLVANFVLLIIFAIPCIGQAVAPALAIPIYAYFASHFAARIEDMPRPKRKRT